MICLFGGTFDPVHVGHVHAAIAVCDALALPRIQLVLSARPSHRNPTAASVADRWHMLCLACEVDARLVANDCEVNRQRPSYTVETLSEFRAEAGDVALQWVIGSDALADLAAWYRWREVLELCNLVVLQRPGHADYPVAVQQLLERCATDVPPRERNGQIFFLPDAMPGVSASEVRRKLGLGQDVGHLLNPQVATYITQQGLYGVAREG